MVKVVEANTEIRFIQKNPYWVVVNKPAPLIAHPIPRKKEPSLSELIREKTTDLGLQPERISMINRLDRETSGVCLIALKKESARIFGKAMGRRAFQKKYEAIVLGHLEKEDYRIHEPILPEPDVQSSEIWVRQIIHPEGKPCTTLLKVIKRFMYNSQRLTHIELLPETGRMHQLRVHCAHLGHPIIGDKLYCCDGRHYLTFIKHGWTTEMTEDLILPRQALHASELSYGDDHWVWKAPLPADFMQILSS